MEGMVLLIAPVGVLAAIGLTWLCGGLVDVRVESQEEAAARLRELEPGFEVERVSLDVEGRGAMICGRRDGQPRFAALFAFGDAFVSRVFCPEELQGVQIGDSGVIVIRRRDFTCPQIRLHLETGEAAGWRRRLAEIGARRG